MNIEYRIQNIQDYETYKEFPFMLTEKELESNTILRYDNNGIPYMALKA